MENEDDIKYSWFPGADKGPLLEGDARLIMSDWLRGDIAGEAVEPLARIGEIG